MALAVAFGFLAVGLAVLPAALKWRTAAHIQGAALFVLAGGVLFAFGLTRRCVTRPVPLTTKACRLRLVFTLSFASAAVALVLLQCGETFAMPWLRGLGIALSLPLVLL